MAQIRNRSMRSTIVLGSRENLGRPEPQTQYAWLTCGLCTALVEPRKGTDNILSRHEAPRTVGGYCKASGTSVDTGLTVC